MKFVKCESCKAETSAEKCVFAMYKKIINGEEHHFCCESCANSYKRK